MCWMRIVRNELYKFSIEHQWMRIKFLKSWIYYHVGVDQESSKILYWHYYKNMTNYNSKIQGDNWPIIIYTISSNLFHTHET